MDTSWKKIIFYVLDVVLAFYLVMAVTSWNTPDKSRRVCTKVNINISDSNNSGFLSAKEIKSILEKDRLYPLNKQLNAIVPRKIEEALKVGPFVDTAQCYITENGHVNIRISQPINKSEFWLNQIEQINVRPDKGIEFVPRIGDHIIFIGYLPIRRNKAANDKGIEEFVTKKLERTEKFYRYGLSQAGWNKYSYINVEFDNQIICKRKAVQQQNGEQQQSKQEEKIQTEVTE